MFHVPRPQGEEGFSAQADHARLGVFQCGLRQPGCQLDPFTVQNHVHRSASKEQRAGGANGNECVQRHVFGKEASGEGPSMICRAGSSDRTKMANMSATCHRCVPRWSGCVQPSWIRGFFLSPRSASRSKSTIRLGGNVECRHLSS